MSGLPGTSGCVNLYVWLPTHLQDEHVLSQVIPVLEDDAHGVFGQRGGVGAFELQPQRLLLGRHHLALLNLCVHTKTQLIRHWSLWVQMCVRVCVCVSHQQSPSSQSGIVRDSETLRKARQLQGLQFLTQLDHN